MTPEAQGAVERAAEVLAAHDQIWFDSAGSQMTHWTWRCACRAPLGSGRSTSSEEAQHERRAHLAEAIVAALATPPTASHDETALTDAEAEVWEELWETDAARSCSCPSCNFYLPDYHAHKDEPCVLQTLIERILAARAAAGDADGGRAGGGGRG